MPNGLINIKIKVIYVFDIVADTTRGSWSAHKIEELVNPGKIIRPAYKSVAEHKEYVPIDERE